VLEAKQYGDRSGLGQPIYYMGEFPTNKSISTVQRRFLTSLGIVHHARIQEKKKNDTAYGVLTDSYYFTFVCMRNDSP
jgi:hypothetical protein